MDKVCPYHLLLLFLEALWASSLLPSRKHPKLTLFYSQTKFRYIYTTLEVHSCAITRLLLISGGFILFDADNIGISIRQRLMTRGRVPGDYLLLICQTCRHLYENSVLKQLESSWCRHFLFGTMFWRNEPNFSTFRPTWVKSLTIQTKYILRA